MKRFKKLTALLVALAMMVALMPSILAEESTEDATEPTKYTISIKSGDDHSYSVYQILTGDYDSEMKNLSNVEKGSSVTLKTGKTLDNFLKAITAANADALALIDEYFTLGDPVATIGTKEDNKTASVPGGYYLIKDTSTVASGDTYTKYIVKVVQNVEIERKADVPQSDKKLKDKNDTDGKLTDWTDSADWDIGDRVPFKLSATIASDYAYYTKGYSLTFHDVMDPGLTFDPKSVVVKVINTSTDDDGKEVSTVTTLTKDDDYTIVQPGTETSSSEDEEVVKCTFEVHFANTKSITAIQAGSVITVEYEAELNTGANIGKDGNWNKSNITFTNNPNVEGAGENGSTEWDEVVVFTYTFEGTKVNEKNEPLEGAEFTLYKKVMKEDGTTALVKVGSPQTSTIPTGGNDAVFGWKGLDDGVYVLKETRTPSGYNTMDDITFEIKADHTVDPDKLELKTLTCTKDDFTTELNTGLISGTIKNTTGSTLPSTGGIGTTIFYTVGGIMVVAAVVLLITKKRMNTNK